MGYLCFLQKPLLIQVQYLLAIIISILEPLRLYKELTSINIQFKNNFYQEPLSLGRITGTAAWYSGNDEDK